MGKLDHRLTSFPIEFEDSEERLLLLSGFTAPSDVAVDDRGNVFVCDVNQFIPILRMRCQMASNRSSPKNLPRWSGK